MIVMITNCIFAVGFLDSITSKVSSNSSFVRNLFCGVDLCFLSEELVELDTL